MRILSVAEKPSVARELSAILSGNSARSRPGVSRYNVNYDFDMQWRGAVVQMTVTSVAGHLMEIDFPKEFRGWRDVPPVRLFDAPIVKVVPEKMRDIERNLQQESRRAHTLMLWLDCDREGENIAFEVVKVCCGANERLNVFRARFSSLIAAEIVRACETAQAPNERESDAVDARQELDLRIGAAFTRFLTLSFCGKYEELRGRVLSFGPCQFPTLGFVVDRYIRIQAFRPEKFWTVTCTHRREPPAHAGDHGGGDGNDMAALRLPVRNESVSFTWERGHVFDRNVCLVLFERMVEFGTARVTKVDRRQNSKWRPLPLTTVEMQMAVSQRLRISSDRCMVLAEELYQQGIISYPRTETDKFADGMDLHELIRMQVAAPAWGAYASGFV